MTAHKSECRSLLVVTTDTGRPKVCVRLISYVRTVGARTIGVFRELKSVSEWSRRE